MFDGMAARPRRFRARSPVRGTRCLIGLALAGVALACSRSDGAGSSTSTLGNDERGAAGASAALDSSEGDAAAEPAPSPADASAADAACSGAECENSCRCATLEGFIEDVGEYDTERTSLECRCSAEACPASVAEAEQVMCNRQLQLGVQRREGCGKVVIADANGFAGDAWVFERALESSDAAAASERLVGAIEFADIASAPCNTYVWVAGSDFDCEEIVTCQLCGDSPIPAPPCE